tara:strand:+ start:6311 stop:6502 length:192 start_codon:yes stop_codon:yes gene_type:complete
LGWRFYPNNYGETMRRKTYMRNRGFTSHRLSTQREDLANQLIKKIRKVIKKEVADGEKTKSKG